MMAQADADSFGQCDELKNLTSIFQMTNIAAALAIQHILRTHHRICQKKLPGNARLMTSWDRPNAKDACFFDLALTFSSFIKSAIERSSRPWLLAIFYGFCSSLLLIA